MSNASASILGVEGELKAHKACFFAGSVFFLLRSAPGWRLFRGTDVLATCWGFWAMIVHSSGSAERTLNPASVSSDGKVRTAEVRLIKWRVPKGVIPVKSCERSWGNFCVKP